MFLCTSEGEVNKSELRGKYMVLLGLGLGAGSISDVWACSNDSSKPCSKLEVTPYEA